MTDKEKFGLLLIIMGATALQHATGWVVLIQTIVILIGVWWFMSDKQEAE